MDNIRFSFIKMKHNSISNKKNKWADSAFLYYRSII